MRTFSESLTAIRVVCVLCLLLFTAIDGVGAEPDTAVEVEKPKPPKLVIRGLGLLDNRKLKRTIQQTYPEEKRNQPYDANFIEDSFVILRNQLQVDGFQEADEIAFDEERPRGGGEHDQERQSELESERSAAVEIKGD